MKTISKENKMNRVMKKYGFNIISSLVTIGIGLITMPPMIYYYNKGYDFISVIAVCVVLCLAILLALLSQYNFEGVE